MSRLTKRDNRTKSGCRLPTYATKNEEDVFVKLFQLENLEDSLGIDLITLFKAINKGIWFNYDDLYDDLEKNFTLRPRLYYSDSFKCYCFEISFGSWIVKLKDYQKTWWLKEDLEID